MKDFDLTAMEPTPEAFEFVGERTSSSETWCMHVEFDDVCLIDVGYIADDSALVLCEKHRVTQDKT